MDPQAPQSELEKRLQEALKARKTLEAEVISLRRANQDLSRSEDRFRLLALHIDQAFWMTSPDERDLYYVSPAYEAILGRSCESLYADPSSWIDCLHQEDRRAVRAAVHKRPEMHADHRDQEFRVVRPDGSSRWVWLRSAPVFDGGEFVARASVAMDITQRKHAEEELRSAALHDKLTRLPNRALLTERLTRAIQRAAEDPGYKFAVLFLDFDRFKIINDSLGHEVGDLLLVSIAQRLKASLRVSDTPSHLGDGHVPARLGGDEFVILLDGIK